MPIPFQEWASNEIRRLRAEADSLELTLRKYLAAEASEAPKTKGAAASNGEQVQPRSRNRGRPSSASTPKNAIMLDFIKKSGLMGVTVDEIYRFAKEPPIGVEINSSRAMLWGLKKHGRVVVRDNRYYGTDSGKPGSHDPGLPLEH
jgi:hypothetical protein